MDQSLMMLQGLAWHLPEFHSQLQKKRKEKKRKEKKRKEKKRKEKKRKEKKRKEKKRKEKKRKEKKRKEKKRKEKKRKEKFTLFSDHNGSLPRRQPGGEGMYADRPFKSPCQTHAIS